MNKKIICIGIVSMFLLTGLTTVSAVEMKAADAGALGDPETIYVDGNADKLNIVIHLYKDKNKNGIQDPDELDSEVSGAKVKLLKIEFEKISSKFTETKVVDENGNVQFELPYETNWMVCAWIGNSWLQKNIWKVCRDYPLVYANEEKTVNVGLTYHTSYPVSQDVFKIPSILKDFHFQRLSLFTLSSLFEKIMEQYIIK